MVHGITSPKTSFKFPDHSIGNVSVCMLGSVPYVILMQCPQRHSGTFQQ